MSTSHGVLTPVQAIHPHEHDDAADLGALAEVIPMTPGRPDSHEPDEAA